MKIKIFKSLGLAATSIICILPSQVSAHGYPLEPKARQAFCLDQGGYWDPADGSAIPNAACRAAFLESGHYPFTQSPEFAANVANYNSQADVEAAVVDGTLCAGGDVNKSGMNIPSADWQRTDVTPDANGNIQMVYKAHTAHNPSFWKFYLTKPSFNAATDNPNWADLELVQEYANVPLSAGTSGTSVYEMDIALPSGRDGDAILFTRWQRDDLVGEGFYTCSDITITGSGTTDPVWSGAGFFIKQGQTAQVGDVVRARLFSQTGQELINQVVEIDVHNLANWQESLANTLVTDHSQLIGVGVKNGQDEIVFNGADLAVNQVWVQDTNHTFNLTVAPPTPNTAPVVNITNPGSGIEYTVGDSLAFSVEATDQDGAVMDVVFNLNGTHVSTDATAPYTHNWTATAAGSQSLSVTATDDKGLTTTKSVTFLVIADEPTCTVDAWDASAAYFAGAQVSKDGILYQAKWWSQGKDPATSGQWGDWAVVGPCQ